MDLLRADSLKSIFILSLWFEGKIKQTCIERKKLSERDVGQIERERVAAYATGRRDVTSRWPMLAG